MTILYIILAIIAFILWKIYRQKEDEKNAIYNEKLDAEHEQARKEDLKTTLICMGSLREIGLMFLLIMLKTIFLY